MTIISQNDFVLYLLKERSLTARQAASEGITRLAARVYDLKAKGHNITKEMISVHSRWEGDARIARYSYEK